jgi:hypothetical protein
MTSHRMQFSAVTAVLFTLFIVSSAAPPADKVVLTGNSVAATKASSVRTAANWTFEGCWTQFSAGTCRDVFRDQQGDFWIYRDFGTTGNPGPGKCSRISPATLASGFWCS